MNWLTLLESSVWFGSAALGFAILFNVPERTLATIWLLGAAGGVVKLLLLGLGVGPIMAAFIGASTVGWLSIAAAHQRHAPPLVFSIAAVIPMIPGVFAYRTMLGIIQLTGEVGDAYGRILAETVNNGVKATFIIMALAVGVGVPNLLTRKESAKQIRIGKR